MKFEMVSPLVAKANGYLSRAVFKRITLSPRMYTMRHKVIYGL